MAVQTLIIKEAIKDAFVDETDVGGDFFGFRVYTEDSQPYRKFYPYIIIFNPATSLIGRNVGGGRIFQLVSRVEIYFTDKETMDIDGVIYKRDDVAKIYGDRAEKLLESLTIPTTVTIHGIPDAASVTNVNHVGRFRIYQLNVAFLVDYIEND